MWSVFSRCAPRMCVFVGGSKKSSRYSGGSLEQHGAACLHATLAFTNALVPRQALDHDNNFVGGGDTPIMRHDASRVSRTQQRTLLCEWVGGRECAIKCSRKNSVVAERICSNVANYTAPRYWSASYSLAHSADQRDYGADMSISS